MVHPAAVAGTKSEVLGERSTAFSKGGSAPRVIAFAVVQTYFVIWPPHRLTVAVDEVGRVTQSCGSVTVPSSIDQRGPDVTG